jgi:hypothetical protein
MNFSKVTSYETFWFLIALFIPHVFFVFFNLAPWAWDQAWYAEETFKAVNVLTSDPLNYPMFLLTQFGFKAPLIAWVSQIWVPLARWYGRPEVILINSVMFSVGGTLFLDRALSGHSRSTRLLAMMAICGFPLFFGMNREFFVEPIQFFSVAWVVYLYQRRKEIPFYDLIVSWVIAMGIGVGAKVSTPLYSIIWSGSILIEIFSRLRSREPFKLKSWYVIGGVVCGLIGAWYLRNSSNIFQFLRETSSGAVAMHYGHSGTLIGKFCFWWHKFIEAAFGGRTRNLTMAILIIGLAVKLKQGSWKRIALAATQFLLVLTVFSSQINEETRYLLPLFPSLVMALVEMIPEWRWARFGFAMILIFRFFELNVVSLGKFDNQVDSPWIGRFQRRGEELDSLDKLIRLVCGSSNSVGMVGVDLPELNNLVFNYRIAFSPELGKTGCVFHSLGYAVPDVTTAMRSFDEFHPGWFVTYDNLTLSGLKDTFNKVVIPVADTIRTSNSWQRFPGNWGRLEVYGYHP